jgi:hypothetical protein
MNPAPDTDKQTNLIHQNILYISPINDGSVISQWACVKTFQDEQM